jgi:hypothetical protein
MVTAAISIEAEEIITTPTTSKATELMISTGKG